MMEQRLIDANALKEKISSLAITVAGIRAGKDILRDILLEYGLTVLRIIEEQPTIEAEPVKHGRWLYVDGKGTNAEYECEECRGHVCFDEKIDGSIPHYKRCPNCGAKMDLEVTNGLDQH